MCLTSLNFARWVQKWVNSSAINSFEFKDFVDYVYTNFNTRVRQLNFDGEDSLAITNIIDQDVR